MVEENLIPDEELEEEDLDNLEEEPDEEEEDSSDNQQLQDEQDNQTQDQSRRRKNKKKPKDKKTEEEKRDQNKKEKDKEISDKDAKSTRNKNQPDKKGKPEEKKVDKEKIGEDNLPKKTQVKQPPKGSQAQKGAKQGEKAVENIAKKSEKAAEQASKVAKQTAQGAKQAAQGVQKAIQVAQQTAKAAVEGVKTGIQAIRSLAPLLANPYFWLVVLIIVIIVVIMFIFMGGVNGISSLSGGSAFISADYNNPNHRALVERLKRKMDGPLPKLEIYTAGVNDLDWDCSGGATTTNTTSGTVANTSGAGCRSKLDLRLLQTIDYLTDRHEFLRISLLKTNAPEFTRYSLAERTRNRGLNSEANTADSNSAPETRTQEALSAFYTGQAMSITAVDRTEIPALQPEDEKDPAPPILVGWQKTVVEKTIRPIWEEIGYDVGWLDRNINNYESIANSTDEQITRIAESCAQSLNNNDSMDLYKETLLRKLPRIAQLLTRIRTRVLNSRGIDARTKAYFKEAEITFAPFNDLTISQSSSSGEIAQKIKTLSRAENIDRLRRVIRLIYKGTQVANIAGWAKSTEVEYQEAYEARTKIRQVIKELLEMPRITGGSSAGKFNNDLVVKQIITFSPEDDLDNGLLGLDIFPQGMTAVSEGGVGMNIGSGNSNRTSGDGIYDYRDEHFSHPPIDNGVFSKHGINFVYRLLNPQEQSWLTTMIGSGAVAGSAAAAASPVPGLAAVVKPAMEVWSGGCRTSDSVWDYLNPISNIRSINEVCIPFNYKSSLYVAF